MPLAAAPRVFSIASGNRFLEVLAHELLAGRIVPGAGREAGPLALAAATIYVPTRRAAEALTQCFASRAEGATLLPRILPLGALEPLEDSLLLADSFASPGAAPPPPMPAVERRLALARMTGAWNAKLKTAHGARGGDERLAVAASARDALMLADELGRLIDEFNIEGVPWEKIAALAPGHDLYWDWTQTLLEIAGTQWPRHLAENSVIDASERQNLLIRAEAARLQALCPGEPFIVAGSTGSRPATAELMRVIARLPGGAIVLPGLDTHLDETGWNAIGLKAEGEPLPAHPQEGMKRLIAHLGCDRRDAAEVDAVSGPLALRRGAVSEIMRPAATTDQWLKVKSGAFAPEALAAAWRDVSIIEARTGREEAVAIALALRQALDTPGKTAALITPDRALAARVQAELKRWNILAADSAGKPLALTDAGLLARLIAETAAQDFSAASLAALLSHRAVTLGETRARAAAHSHVIEIACLRGGKLAPGAEGLRQAIRNAPERVAERHAPPYRARIAPEALAEAGAMLECLIQALAPLRQAIAAENAQLPQTFPALLGAYENITAPPPGAERRALHGEAALADLAEAVAAAGGESFSAPAYEFPGAAEALMAGIAVPDFHAGHPRLHILGLLESRLLHADLVIAAGLSEGVWPPAAETGPFLNRPMRAELGFDPPERRIGQTALDFCAALSAPEVIIARAARAGSEPAIPSRFLRRMQAFLGSELWAEMTARGGEWLALAAALDAPLDLAAEDRPAPAPPLAARPVSLSVSDIPRLYRDPYEIYAKHILRLKPFEELDPGYGAGDRGDWIHQAIAEALKQDHGADEARWLEAFLAAGIRAFAPAIHDPEVAAFWVPRYEAAAGWLAAAEAERRPDILRCLVEQSGRLKFPLADNSEFELSARLDRADLLPGGGFDVFDYKSGGAPSADEVKRGFAPQLTLEAHMIAAGAFKAIAAGGKPGRLAYIRVTGGEQPCEEKSAIAPRGPPVEDLIANDVMRLTTILSRFRDVKHGYASRLAAVRTRRGDYDHLARAGEWPPAGEGGSE